MSGPLWTTAAMLRAHLQRMWDDGRVLSAHVSGESMFPLTVGVRQPTATDLGSRFDEVRNWIRELELGSKASKGHGYDIEWRDINHRQLGRNRVPAQLVLATEADALRLIGAQADARRFDLLSATTLAAFPQLAVWLARRPMTLLEQAPAWERMVAILQWFVSHPRAEMYLRQLDIAGVDGKFIETRKALLADLLDHVLPQDAVDDRYIGARQFEQRYGLLAKPPLVRFRLLDTRHYIGGLSDLTIPVAQFAALQTKVERVFVTENEINGLAFPDVAHSMVVFGGGYGIDRLADIAWLQDRDIIYWGDIDTHGFAILNRLRASLPYARSILMDRTTLEQHRLLWGEEEPQKRYTGTPTRLTEQEFVLFNLLRDNVLGERVRMEQERLGYAWVVEAIQIAAKSLAR